MKLRNKKTGEIVDFETGIYADTEDSTYEFSSIAELNELLEDVPEEPKEYWYIGDSGEVWVFNHNYLDTEIEEVHKEIGNYFETKEEAEKSVEKLKAWKRLKDKGFEITGWAIYPLPDEFLDGKRIWYNTILRGRIDFEIPLDNSKDIDKELEHFVTDEEGDEEGDEE